MNSELPAEHSEASNLDNGNLILGYSICTYIYVCVQLHSCFIKECNKVSIASAYCSSLGHETAAIDSDCERSLLTPWKQHPGLHQ